MYHVDLRGSYAEMGRQQGLILREAGFGLPPPEPKMLRFARRCEELVTRRRLSVPEPVRDGGFLGDL